MDDIVLRAYSGRTGKQIGRLDYSSLSWADSLNDEGSLSSKISGDVDAPALLPPYKTVLCASSGKRIFHAGYVTHLSFDRSAMTWSLDCGGGITVLDKRLVLNKGLMSSWSDGYVVVDEENPSGDWPLKLTGSYSDIVRGLILETCAWGELPFTVSDWQDGGHERNYNSYDLATVADRIREISQLADGPEIRFDPVINGSNLKFVQRTAEEIIDHKWKWNTLLPDCPVSFDDEDDDGELLCSQCFATGGREKDSLLVSSSRSESLITDGWPLLQMANTQHSDVSELQTLKSYSDATVSQGDKSQRVYGLKADISLDIRVGDWAEIRTEQDVIPLKVTDVSGSSGDSHLKVQARRRV